MEPGLWYRPVVPSAQEDEAGASQAAVQIELETIRQLRPCLKTLKRLLETQPWGRALAWCVEGPEVPSPDLKKTEESKSKMAGDVFVLYVF